MQNPDNKAAASVMNEVEIPEEGEISEVSVVPQRRISPELPPLPLPPLLELPTLPNLPEFPELSPSTGLSPLPRIRALFASTSDPEREFPPMPRTWGKPEAERTAERSQPPNQSTPRTQEEETFDFLKWRLSAQLECLLCIEIMMPPIMVCWNGHMICNNCRPKLEKCPLCRYSKTSLIRLQLILFER
jgi:hypothetical protein